MPEGEEGRLDKEWMGEVSCSGNSTKAQGVKILLHKNLGTECRVVARKSLRGHLMLISLACIY